MGWGRWGPDLQGQFQLLVLFGAELPIGEERGGREDNKERERKKEERRGEMTREEGREKKRRGEGKR